MESPRDRSFTISCQQPQDRIAGICLGTEPISIREEQQDIGSYSFPFDVFEDGGEVGPPATAEPMVAPVMGPDIRRYHGHVTDCGIAFNDGQLEFPE